MLSFADVPNPINFNLSTLIAEYSKNQTLAELYFQEKYARQTFEIGIARTSFDVERNYFDEKGLDVVFDAIKLFGHLMKSVRINNFDLNSNQTLKVNSYINEYCTQSLTHLQIDYGAADRMLNLVGPFIHLERLDIRFGFLRFNQSNFDKTFPALVQLDIGIMTFTSGCFEHHFPSLEYLSIGNWPSTEKIIQLNPQLKHVQLFHGHWDLVQKISKWLINLESLEIREFIDQSIQPDEMIHFVQLKSLKFELLSEVDDEYFIADYSNHTKIPLVFGNLEKIECFEPSQQWFHIIIKNRQLKQLTTGKLNANQFMRIAEELTYLEELMVDYNACGSTGMIVNFLKKCAYLQKASFPKCHFNENEISVKLSTEWKLQNCTFYRIDRRN